MQNPPNMDGPSIQISDVRMTDEGKYMCEVASYPSGHEQGITQLVMLSKSPEDSLYRLYLVILQYVDQFLFWDQWTPPKKNQQNEKKPTVEHLLQTIGKKINLPSFPTHLIH